MQLEEIGTNNVGEPDLTPNIKYIMAFIILYCTTTIHYPNPVYSNVEASCSAIDKINLIHFIHYLFHAPPVFIIFCDFPAMRPHCYPHVWPST